jgi:hypothetical protein
MNTRRGVRTMADTAELDAIAARARQQYPEYDVGVCYGFLLRATWGKATGTPVPVEATTEGDLFGGIARQVRMREMDAQRAGRAR